MSMRMAMGHGGGPPGGGWGLMRSLRQDQSVLQSKLPKGIVRRVLAFAKPYPAMLGAFLFLIVLDAVIGVVTPLIYRAIIDKGIPQKNTSLVVGLALIVA